MSQPALYPRVLAGYVETDAGEDARVLAERVAEADGGELTLLHVDRGSPAGRLRELAERGEADLIVLGSTHHAAIGSVSPGSVAEHLLKGTPVRLLIAPRGFARARGMREAGERGEGADDGPARERLPYVRDELRVVAVGFNGTVESRAALKEASVLASKFGAALRVISVAEAEPAALGPAGSGPPRPRSGHDLQDVLHDACAQLPAEVRAQPIFERGDPGEKLLEHAEEGVDLMVLGSRGFGPVMRAMIGSVSAKVIRRAPCAVMIVPRPAGSETSSPS